MTWIAWLAVIVAIWSLIDAAVNFSKMEHEEEQAQKNEEIFQLKHEMNKLANDPQDEQEQIDPRNAVECIFCGKLIDKTNPVCKHCGRRQD